MAACWKATFHPAWVIGDPYDFVRQFLSDRAYQVQSLHRLELPSWNPVDLMGVPYIASIQPAFFSPSTWVVAGPLALVGASITPKLLGLGEVAHLAFAGIGVLVCARLLRLSSWAGLAGGLTYALSGFLVGQAGHVNQQNTAALLPWAAAALVHLGREPSPRRAAVGAGAIGAVILAGHPQIAGYSLLVLVAGAAWMAARRPRTIPWLAAAFAGGVALSAVATLPLLQYSRLAVRTGEGYDYATTYSTPIGHFADFVVPHALGSSQATYAGTPSLGEYYGYAGLAPLLLLPLVLADRRRRRLGIALIAAAGAAFLFALGRNGPVFPVLYPVLSRALARFRNPGRAIVVADFGLALLAALAVDRVVHARRQLVLLSASAVAVAILVVAVVPRVDQVRARRSGIVLAAVLLAALTVAALSRRPEIVVLAVLLDLGVSSGSAFLVKPGDPPYRDAAAAVAVRNLEGLSPGAVPDFRVESDAGTLGLEQDDGAAVGVAKTMGDDSLVFAPYVELRAQLGFLNAQGVQLSLFGTERLASPFLDLFGARYLFTTRSPGQLAPAAEAKYDALRSVQGVWIYRNPKALPLAWLVGAQVPPAGPNALEQVDFRTTAATVTDRPLNGRGAAGEARVDGQGASWVRVVADVDGPRGAILATSFLDYPGWLVTVDGRAADRLRVNHAFRGTWLAPGHHVVVWRFVNRPLRVGLLISGATLIVLAGAAVFDVRSRLGFR